MEIIVDHAHRGTAAGGKALGEFDGEISAGRHRDGMVVRVALRPVDAREFAQALHELVLPPIAQESVRQTRM